VAELEAARIGTIHSLAAAIAASTRKPPECRRTFTILDDLQGPIWIGTNASTMPLDGIDPSLYGIHPVHAPAGRGKDADVRPVHSLPGARRRHKDISAATIWHRLASSSLPRPPGTTREVHS